MRTQQLIAREACKKGKGPRRISIKSGMRKDQADWQKGRWRREAGWSFWLSRDANRGAPRFWSRRNVVGRERNENQPGEIRKISERHRENLVSLAKVRRSLRNRPWTQPGSLISAVNVDPDKGCGRSFVKNEQDKTSRSFSDCRRRSGNPEPVFQPNSIASALFVADDTGCSAGMIERFRLFESSVICGGKSSVNGA